MLNTPQTRNSLIISVPLLILSYIITYRPLARLQLLGITISIDHVTYLIKKVGLARWRDCQLFMQQLWF